MDKPFGRRFKLCLLPTGDLESGSCQNGRALPPALPYPACHRQLDLHSITAFGPETGNQLKIFANYQTVLFGQTRLSEFINSTNYERMQHCIYNENIKQIKSSTTAELNSERKRDSSCNHSAVTWALIEFLYDILKEEFNDV